ncbi:MAG: pyruvate ferredoxin oxidoreductase gamma subunit [Candidatus Woesearchaeota archaeon]|nr:pyruvate ferredoxin oxidoreductase gamma subunit [Candidatus Woesearchaeota archaeon]MDN5328105.1 pyruvate ferredoxin oxidoreductase gamma subunit [Candidatus Woesearchaeota archaeon]
MKDLIEIRFHGRGGQGAKSAAQILAEAVMLEGKYMQAFPEYGPERTGAPMKAFVRISEKKIRTYQPVVNPDYLVVIDPSLIGFKDLIMEGVTNETVFVLNSKKSADEIKQFLGFDGKVYVIDANDIAIRNIGVNKSNMPMLGALVKVSNLVDINKVIEVFSQHFKNKLSEEVFEGNIKAIWEAYNGVNL